MSVRDGLFTSEAVSSGHPDKLCDRISDAILAEFLTLDPKARVACETFATNNKIIVAGEFRTARREHFEQVRRHAPAIVRQGLTDVGYGTADHDIDPSSCGIEILFNHQSAEIAAGVDGSEILGAGDQGLMFGYATAETEALMPLAWSLATDLIATGTTLRQVEAPGLKPDAKSQVTVRYENGRAVGIQTVVLSWQHDPGLSLTSVRELLLNRVVDSVIPAGQRTSDFCVFINPAGAWTVGGPKGDTGLTGRKIIVDTYGGACPHGGGAFSGKDPSKVDRSGAYAARWVAKTTVAAGLATRCTVQVAYAIGISEPVSIYIDVHGTGVVSELAIERAVRQVFDLSPGGIIRDLDLLRPIYTATSSLGHFGPWRDPRLYRWESTERASALLAYARRSDRNALPNELPKTESSMAIVELTRDKNLLAAYAATHFTVTGTPTPFVLRVGQRSAELAAMYLADGVNCSAFLTAFNPTSVPQPEAINRASQERLETELTAMGLTVLAGFGEDPSGAWPGEASVLVLGMSRNEAERVGRAFGQLAIVWSGETAVPELVVLRRSG